MLDKKISDRKPLEEGFEEEIIIFHHDNAPVRTIVLATGKLRGPRYESLKHPLTTDLVHSAFHLFPKL